MNNEPVICPICGKIIVKCFILNIESNNPKKYYILFKKIVMIKIKNDIDERYEFYKLKIKKY